MNIGELFRLAFRALGSNKLRSALTMLGIIIGVGAVITLMSVGEGVQRLITTQIQGAGSNLLFVVPGQVGGGGGGGSITAAPLTLREAEALASASAVPDAVEITPELTQQVTAERGNRSRTSTLSATTPNYAIVRNHAAALGRFLDERDLTTRARVAVLGSGAYERFFPNGGYPLGETIKLNGISFQIVGVLEEKGASGLGSEDNFIWVPLTTAQSRLFNLRTTAGDPIITSIYVEVNGEENLSEARRDIIRTLRAERRIAPGAEEDFSVISQRAILDIFGQITGTLTTFLAAIAAISLLVGGIGIMNIMLVSVTERTREIGIRKAIGAKRRDILLQFLIEAVVLSVVGGLLGILLGWAGATAFATVAEELEAPLSPFAVTLATSVSIIVGLTFGLYPAIRASRLNPIEALRYE